MRRWLMRGALALLTVVGALLGYLRYEGIPLHATRHAPPPGIEGTAISVGATAPPIELATADGAAWRSSDALAAGPAVLIFYRGHW